MSIIIEIHPSTNSRELRAILHNGVAQLVVTWPTMHIAEPTSDLLRCQCWLSLLPLWDSRQPSGWGRKNGARNLSVWCGVAMVCARWAMSGFTSGCWPAKKATSERIGVLNPYTMSLNVVEGEGSLVQSRRRKKRRISQWDFTWGIRPYEINFWFQQTKNILKYALS